MTITTDSRFDAMQLRHFLFAVACVGIVVGSNLLVQVPLNNWLTWGGLSYPVAFLVTDVLNRRFGPAAALIVSIWLASPRIALASGAA